MITWIAMQIEMSKLLALPDELNTKSQKVIDDTMEVMEGLAADNAHMITGAMRAGIYSVTVTKSTYEAAAAAAAYLNPDAIIGPPIDTPEPLVGVLADVVDYAIFEEFGSSTHGPHPFMGPAAMQGEAIFNQKFEDMGRTLGE